jgi:hypothetical protein
MSSNGSFPSRATRFAGRRYCAWLAAYAAATSTTTAYSKILDAAAAGLANKPAKQTTLAYRDALSSLWLLDAIPPWIPSRNHLDRLGQSPKHHLADPALVARLLGLDDSALLRAEQGRYEPVAGHDPRRAF